MKKVIRLFLISVFFVLLIGFFSKVFGAEDVQINVRPNTENLTTSDLILIIELSSNKLFETGSSQAVQILLGEESPTNKWTELGTGTNGVALKKTYNYMLKSNSKVTVRAVSWKDTNKSDLTVLESKTIEISNIDKTDPVIEKVEANVSENIVSLNVLAKDTESGIAKYTCVCDAISFNKTSETSKFDITGLEANKEYNFVISVEDKVGRKTTTNQKLKTKNKQTAAEPAPAPTTPTVQQPATVNEVPTNTVPEQNVNTDTTIANKIIPQVGAKNICLVVVFMFLISIVILNRR